MDFFSFTEFHLSASQQISRLILHSLWQGLVVAIFVFHYQRVAAASISEISVLGRCRWSTGNDRRRVLDLVVDATD